LRSDVHTKQHGIPVTVLPNVSNKPATVFDVGFQIV